MEIHLFSQNGFSIKGRALFHWLLLSSEDCWHFIGDFGKHLAEKQSNFFSKCWVRESFFLPILLFCNPFMRSGCWLLFPVRFCKSGDRSAGGRWTSDSSRLESSLATSKVNQQGRGCKQTPPLVPCWLWSCYCGEAWANKPWLSLHGTGKLVVCGWELGLANFRTAQG